MGRVYIGQEPFLYEVKKSYGDAAARGTMSRVSGVACDSGDRVYVFQRTTPSLLIFDKHGRLAETWGDTPIDAHGIFIGANDSILLVNRAGHHVLKVELSGRSQVLLGTPDRPQFNGPFSEPADVAVSPDGELFVADGYGNFNVHRFGRTGGLISTWGSPGSRPGEFRVPHGIWVDEERRVLVADRENGRVQIFSIDGSYLTEWPWFFRPTDIFVDNAGYTFVTDLVPSISVISPAGELVARGKPVDENAHSVWGNSRGDLFVVQGDASEVVRLALVRP